MAFQPRRTWEQPKRQNAQPRWVDEGTTSRTVVGEHRCMGNDLDYSLVNSGEITCTVCARVWKLHTSQNAKTGVKYSTWWPYPCPGCGTSPERCRHYGNKPRTKKASDD